MVEVKQVAEFPFWSTYLERGIGVSYYLWKPQCMYAQTTGSSVHGILQARILEWVAISYSSGYPSIT